MIEPTPRPEPMYPGEMTDGNIREIFQETGDFNIRRLLVSGQELFGYAIDGLTSGGDISEYVYKPLMERLTGGDMRQLYDRAWNAVVVNSVAVPCKSLDDVAIMLVNGFCVVLFPGVGALAFETKTGEKRGISPPETENTAKGPKDAFVETVRTNTSLLRRHLRSPDLRLFETKVGRRSLTLVTVAYIKGITDPELVQRMKQRLDQIDVDGFLSPMAVEEYITGSRATAFPLLQYTERADRFCQGLLEGRVGLLVDGLPVGYLAPVDIGTLMQSQEDLAKDYVSASCIRLLRYASLLISLLLPGFYIAMAIFHQEMIPLPLLRRVIESKQSVPFSTAVEVIGLLLAFELLQESGVHLPKAIGQSVSIIGGIVVGSAAVEASLISPAALIVVSIAGICGFVLPNRDLADTVRMWRLGLAATAVIGGAFGLTAGLILLLIHLSGLESMGVAYLSPFTKRRNIGVLRDRLFRRKYRDPKFRATDRRNQR